MEHRFLSKGKVFLDITTQVCRLFGDKQSEQNIIQVLSDFFSTGATRKKLITSSVVYAKFLNTLVKDIIRVRDLIKTHFLDQMDFRLDFKALKGIANRIDFPGVTETEKICLRNRLELLCEILEVKYSCSQSLETKRVLRFLDSYSRDLIFRDFFYIRIGGKMVDIEFVDPDIDCTVQKPLQIDCEAKKGERCVVGIYIDNSGHSKCLLVEAPVFNCNLRKTMCFGITDFLTKKKKVKQKLKLLLDEAKQEMPFSVDFRECNGELIEFLSELTGNCSNLEGRECDVYFHDILIFLLCPDNAFILSRKKKFEELGKVTDRPDVLVTF